MLVVNAVNQFVMEDLQHMTIVMSGTTKVVFKIYSIVHNGYTENNKLEWEWCNCAIKTFSFPLFKAAVSEKFGDCSACASLKIWWIITHEN